MMKTDEELLSAQNSALRRFVELIGFDPETVAVELSSDADNLTCKYLALQGVCMQRDFSKSTLSEAGVLASNKWLDTLVRPRTCVSVDVKQKN